MDILHHNSKGEWFFWDEVWANSHGPYNSKQEASEALTKYALELDSNYVKKYDFDFCKSCLNKLRKWVADGNTNSLSS